MKNYFIILVLAMTLLGAGQKAFATDCVPGPDGYCALSPLPGVSDATGRTNLNTYIKGMFQLAIGLAGVLAVLRIIMGGITYMTTDAFDNKSEAKQTIQDAIIGLLLAISAYTILATVNPKLVDFQFGVEGLKLGAPISSSSTPPGTDPIGASGCSTCAPMPDQSTIPHKNPGPRNSGAGCLEPGPCVLSQPLMHKLTLLNIAAKKLNPQITWQVTEMFPPTVPHADPCHNNGTCADAKIIAPTTNKIIQFLTIMEENGITDYAYEKCPQSEANKLILSLAATKFGSRIKCYETTTGESLHINQ